MGANDYKPFATGPSNEVTPQVEYVAADWRVNGWRSGILPHQEINKVLRQVTMVTSAIAQMVADFTGSDVLDDGDLTVLTNSAKVAFSAGLPYVPSYVYPTGSIGAKLKDLNDNGGSWATGANLVTTLTGLLGADQLTLALQGRINLIDAPTTGLVTKVSDLQTAYGSTVSAQISADAAAAAAIDATASKNAAAISAGAAYTSSTIADTAKISATASAGSASTSATNAASSASSAAGSATSASNSATAAANSATTAAGSASAASTQASNAATSATNAATYASAAATSATAASTSASAASTSASAASASATTAAGSASTATTKATQAASSATDAANSATTSANSATTSATQATNAANSAAGAANSASTATTQALNASSSAGAAATSASNAATSSTSAATSASNAATSASNAATSATSATTAKVAAESAAAAAAQALIDQGRVNLAQRAKAAGGTPTVDLAWGTSGWGFSKAGAGANPTLIGQIDVSPLAVSTPYSISFRAKLTSGTSATIQIDLYPDTLPQTAKVINTVDTLYKWENVSSSSSDMATAALRFFAEPLANGVTVEITDIKIEQSQVATVWTPSPLDARNYANAAAGSASTATTQANAAASSASAASGSATTASTQAAAAATSAGNAATSASNASTSSSSAAGSASTATTQAINAANSATAAAGSASAASGSASSASTSASNAATSATAANSAKTAAETAQSAASTSASNAASSATSASGSAASATSSSNTAAISATAAGNSATAANTSASSATTSAAQANNSAQAAADWYNQTVAATGSLSAAVSAEASTRASQVAGLQAQYVLKTVATRADGKKVLGAIGLASTAPNDNTGGQSEILLQADRLVFVPSSNPDAPLANMLTVQTVDGVTTLAVPAARIGDLTVATGKIANNAATALAAISTSSWSVASVSVTITSNDIPSGSSTVPVLVIATDVGHRSEFSKVDVGVNPANYLATGNLFSLSPPYTPNMITTLTRTVNLGVGTYTIAVWNRDVGASPGSDINSLLRSIAAFITKK